MIGFYIFFVLFTIFASFYLAKTTITFKPFSFKIRRWTFGLFILILFNAFWVLVFFQDQIQGDMKVILGRSIFVIFVIGVLLSIPGYRKSQKKYLEELKENEKL